MMSNSEYVNEILEDSNVIVEICPIGASGISSEGHKRFFNNSFSKQTTDVNPNKKKPG